MTTVVEATYDGSVFRPAHPVELEPNTAVRLTVEMIQGTNGPASFLDVAESLNLDGPPDWSANHDRYLYGEDTCSGG